MSTDIGLCSSKSGQLNHALQIRFERVWGQFLGCNETAKFTAKNVITKA